MAIEELRKITKWGNSYGVVIPKKYITALGLKVNDFFVIRLHLEKVELTPYEGNNQQCRKY